MNRAWFVLFVSVPALAAAGASYFGLLPGPRAALVFGAACVAAMACATVFSQAARSQLRSGGPGPISGLRETLQLLTVRTTVQVDDLTRETRTLSAVLDGMAEGIWITDVEGTVIRHNDALKQMLFAGQDLVGQRPLALVRKGELNDAVMRACKNGESAQLEISLEGVRPRTLSVRITPLGNELPGSSAVFHDVTELRRLESIRKDFVANVSHELRTPITAIRGYAETLQDGALQDPNHAAKMVDIIHRQSERLSELVADLLELSRLEAQELELRSGPVSVADALQRARDTVLPKAQSRGIRVELKLPPGLTALADERAVEQVLLNLLDNAVKYTPPGGLVEVSGYVSGDRCVVGVRDTGVGIESKHLPRVFERFYRVDKGRSRDMGGTGLGLSIVKHIVVAMKGEVKVESVPGRGSTFWVLLPSSSQQVAVSE